MIIRAPRTARPNGELNLLAPSSSWIRITVSVGIAAACTVQLCCKTAQDTAAVEAGDEAFLGFDDLDDLDADAPQSEDPAAAMVSAGGRSGTSGPAPGSVPLLAQPEEIDVVGHAVPSFDGDLLAGGHLSSQDLQGKVVLLTFFASWCTACRKELPELPKLQDQYGPRGFTVVAVGVDRKREDASGFLDGVPVNFPVLLDPESRILGQFDVVSMPTAFVIDREGQVRSRHRGYTDEAIGEYKQQIEGLL